MPRDSLANRVYYLPPPNKPIACRAGRTKRCTTSRSRRDLGLGPGPTSLDARQPSKRCASTRRRRVSARSDSVTAPPIVGDTEGDSVFTVLDVDSAVVRSQSSAAPAYPLDLLTKHVEGIVIARYVVDTTGFADTTSFEVLTLDAMRDSFARCARRCRTCASRRRRSARTKCGSSSSSRSPSASRRPSRDGARSRSEPPYAGEPRSRRAPSRACRRSR